MGEGVPVQVPVAAVSVWPCAAVPVTVGSAVSTGPPSDTPDRAGRADIAEPDVAVLAGMTYCGALPAFSPALNSVIAPAVVTRSSALSLLS